jgi:hypothetical protein
MAIEGASEGEVAFGDGGVAPERKVAASVVNARSRVAFMSAGMALL